MDIKVYNELQKLAREYAQNVAPKPKHDPIPAGLFGVLICQAVVISFVNLAGLDMEDFGGPSTIISAISFAVPFFYFRHELNKHDEAFGQEMERLKEQHAEKAAA